MAIYKAKNRIAISEITPAQRLSNQVIFSGSSGNSLSAARGIVFLELLIVDGAGSVEIKDGNGDTISTGVKDFSQDHSPLRCDRGIEIIGDVGFAKAFVIEGVFPS